MKKQDKKAAQAKAKALKERRKRILYVAGAVLVPDLWCLDC